MNDKSEEKTENIEIGDTDNFVLYSYAAVDNTMAITLQKAIKEKVNLTRADIANSYSKSIGEAIIVDGVDFTHGKLNDCVFSNCSMVGIKFNGTRCANAIFNHVNMDRADIKNQEMIGWRFKTCKLTNIDFGTLDISHCGFDGIDFSGSDLSKATYDIRQFENCYMDGAKLNPNPNPDSSELVECGKKIEPVDITNPN